MTASKDDIKQAITAFIKLSRILLETIVHSNGIPNGHLYAECMAVLSFEEYTRIIAVLKDGGFIRESNHFLTPTEKGMVSVKGIPN